MEKPRKKRERSRRGKLRRSAAISGRRERKTKHSKDISPTTRPRWGTDEGESGWMNWLNRWISGCVRLAWTGLREMISVGLDDALDVG